VSFGLCMGWNSPSGRDGRVGKLGSLLDHSGLLDVVDIMEDFFVEDISQ
jgi:hypothetical protein